MPALLRELSPWIDARLTPLEQVLTGLEQQTHRRFMKAHLALDGLRYDRRVKYVYVGRDARDVFMSLWNHYRSYTDMALTMFNTTPGRVGSELPRCPDDIHELWRNWITRVDQAVQISSGHDFSNASAAKCHPEPPAKDLAAAIFAAVICPVLALRTAMVGTSSKRTNRSARNAPSAGVCTF